MHDWTLHSDCLELEGQEGRLLPVCRPSQSSTPACPRSYGGNLGDLLEQLLEQRAGEEVVALGQRWAFRRAFCTWLGIGLRAIMDISAPAILLPDKPRAGCLGHQCSHAPGATPFGENSPHSGVSVTRLVGLRRSLARIFPPSSRAFEIIRHNVDEISKREVGRDKIARCRCCFSLLRIR